MRRIFQAFIWLRFRVLINSLERTGARDAIERFSLATDKLGPIIALVLLIPSSLILFVLGITTGFALAQSDSLVTITIVRYFLLIALCMTILGPIVLPTRDSGSVVRYLLLPIPRMHLYLAQMAGALADPWILLVIPVVVLGIPIGLAVGLKFLAAAIAFLAGLAFVGFQAGLTSLVSSTIHLLLRDRRRGDIVALVAIFVLPMIGLLPQMLIKEERGPGGRPLTHAERQALPPSASAQAVLRLAPYVPSEMYRRTASAAVKAAPRSAVPLLELGLVALLVQAAGFAAYRRVLDMPVSLSARRAGSFGGLWDRVLPGLSPAASAVAFTQLRLALRTPRGRASMVTPLLMPLLLGGMAARRGLSIPGMSIDRGLVLAAIAGFTSILALLPLAVNQFAIDRAGFTRQMLSPISIRALLAGKAVGNGLIAAIPTAVAIGLALAFFGASRPGLWLALLFAFVATFALVAPASAALSALFPRTVDLNSIGHASNAHVGAGLLGLLSLVVSAAPPALLTLLAASYLRRLELLPIFMLVWTVIALGLSELLFIPVRAFVARRCEALAQYY